MYAPDEDTPRTSVAREPLIIPAFPEDNDLLRSLRERGSVRDFTPDPVPEAWVEVLTAAGQRAPTSSNVQAFSIIVVRDPETKKRLAELAGNQQYIIDCPVFLAFCADLTGPAQASELHDTVFNGQTFEAGLVASIDAALVGMTVSLAASTLGLGTVLIGAMRNHPLEVAKLLKLPPRVYVVFGMCLGWPETPPLPKPRLPMTSIVHQEFYDIGQREAALAAYDRELAEYYRAQGRSSPDEAWTKVVAGQWSVPRRKHLREELKILGFDFE